MLYNCRGSTVWNKTLPAAVIWIFLRGLTSVNGQMCRDDNGDIVDWYYVYKIPKKVQDATDETLSSNGYVYAYVTSEMHPANLQWIKSDKNIKDADSIFGNTMEPFYVDDSANKYLMFAYNDQPPNNIQSSHKNAHAKGVVLMGEETGFWLIHTVPTFPPQTNPFTYGERKPTNGQVALCISFNTAAEGGKILDTLKTVSAFVYKSNINSRGLSTFQRRLLVNMGYATNEIQDDLINIVTGPFSEKVAAQNGISFTEVNSMHNVPFEVISQPYNYEEDIYYNFIGLFEQNGFAMWWPKGKKDLFETHFEQFQVTDVRRLRMRFLDSNNNEHQWSWRQGQDHSKWIVSQSPTTPFQYFCISDLNHVVRQMKRGGSIICLENQSVAALFRSMVN